MISFLRKLFARKSATKDSRQEINEAVIQFEDPPVVSGKKYKHPDEDVHKLMIKATGIRKEKGYSAAILFLKEIAEAYLREANTALVTCINKLIPYMKRDSSVSYEEIHQYLEGIIQGIPSNEPYFLSLHITMADLIKSKNIDHAIDYLKNYLEPLSLGPDHYDILIRMIDLFIEKQNIEEAKKLLPKAKSLIDIKTDRYEHIKKERMWFRSSANLSYIIPGENGKIEYLNNRFVEFVLDMAKALNPLQIDLFHQRKDLYYKKERGFEEAEKFNEALNELGLTEEKEGIIKQLYGYAFEELPGILHVSEKQLYFKPGQEESIEELREKKLYIRKPFLELPEVESYIRKLVEKFVK